MSNNGGEKCIEGRERYSNIRSKLRGENGRRCEILGKGWRWDGGEIDWCERNRFVEGIWIWGR